MRLSGLSVNVAIFDAYPPFEMLDHCNTDNVGLQAVKPDDAKLKKEMDLLQAYNLRYNFLANL